MDQVQGKGQGNARGQGQGPMGKPKGANEMNQHFKEAIDLVDIILTGDYNEYKKFNESLELVDEIIDEVENKIDNVPDQDLQSLYKTVFDELSQDSMTPVEESILSSVKKLIKEEDYREFFKGMLKKWNIKSPTDLEGDKKKEFFSQVDKGWKAKKETD